MPPTAVIDSDRENTETYYVLELDKLWRLDKPGTADAAWTLVLTSAMGGVANMQFSRVRVQGGRILVLGAAGTGENRDLYIYHSSNGGTQWPAPTLISSASIVVKPYTVTKGSVVTTGVQYEGYSLPIDKPTPDALPYLICEWKEQSGGYDTGLKHIGSWGHAMPLTSDNYINQFGSVVATNEEQVYFCWRNSILDFSFPTTLRQWCNEVFGTENTVHNTHGGWESTNWNLGNNMLPEAGFIGFQNNTTLEQELKYWIFWNEPEPLQALGFDIAPSNPSWMYIGTENVILKSEDGGYTWAVLIDDYGADDIKVNPIAADTITFWGTDGMLYQAVAGVVQSPILSATRAKVPLRIDYSQDGETIFVLAHDGGEVYQLGKRSGGAWTTLESGIAGARALRVASNGSIIAFLSGTDIMFSNDSGANFGGRKGAWSTFGSPKNIHLG